MQLQNDRQIIPAFAHLQLMQDFELQEQVIVKSSTEIAQSSTCHWTTNAPWSFRCQPQTCGSGMDRSALASCQRYPAMKDARFTWSNRALSEGGSFLKSSIADDRYIFRRMTPKESAAKSFLYISTKNISVTRNRFQKCWLVCLPASEIELSDHLSAHSSFRYPRLFPFHRNWNSDHNQLQHETMARLTYTVAKSSYDTNNIVESA